MSRWSDLVSQTARNLLRTFPPLPPKQAEARLIRLDSNESPYGPSPLAVQAMQAALAEANFYPDEHSLVLRRKLASLHDIPPDQILVTSGSTEMLALLCQTLLGPGLNAITSERSFILYNVLVQASGAELIQTPVRGDGFDREAILRAINSNTRLIFIANPNNPTGTVLEHSVVEAFLARVPAHVVVVLDEAYYDFAAYFATLRRVEYARSLDQVRQRENVLALRTFSKAHGLAGLRVGYAVGPAELLNYCTRMQSVYSVSSIAQVAAVAALDDHEHIAHAVSSNALQSEILTSGLTELGFRVVPTFANFVYCDLQRDASPVAYAVCEEGISVRPLAAWGAASCIRVTVGTAEQNQLFLSAMRKIERKE